MARAEIRPDGKKYRLILHTQEEHRGGNHNTYLRKASYAECQAKIGEWRELRICQ